MTNMIVYLIGTLLVVAGSRMAPTGSASVTCGSSPAPSSS
jgi:hypothetical protein